MTRRSAGARPARIAETRPPNGVGGRRRSRLNAVWSWKLDLLIRDFARFINSDVAMLYEPGAAGQPPTMISSWGVGTSHGQIARPLAGGFVGRALRQPLQRAVLEPLDPVRDSNLIHATDPPLTHAVTVPVRLATGLAGHLVAGFSTAPHDPTLTLWSSESYAALVALCLHNPAALDGLLAAARRDALTGCLTYEGTLRELDREINRSARGGLALSICFIDLDAFKRINDEHGHVRGNDILAVVGRTLREGVRSSDTVGRYGGDEFIALLPQTTENEARQLAQRLRSRLATTRIAPLTQPLTASIGVAQWTPGTSSKQLLGAADSALLAAKARRAGVTTARRKNSTARHSLNQPVSVPV